MASRIYHEDNGMRTLVYIDATCIQRHKKIIAQCRVRESKTQQCSRIHIRNASSIPRSIGWGLWMSHHLFWRDIRSCMYMSLLSLIHDIPHFDLDHLIRSLIVPIDLWCVQGVRARENVREHPPPPGKRQCYHHPVSTSSALLT